MPTHQAVVNPLPAMLLQAPESVPATHASSVKPVEKSKALSAGIWTYVGGLCLISHAPNGCAASGAATNSAKTKTEKNRNRIMETLLFRYGCKMGRVGAECRDSAYNGV